MEWVPQQMWFTYLRIGEQTNQLRYDLAIDQAGAAKPSRVMAGLDAPPPAPEPSTTTTAAPTTTTAKPKPKPKPPVTPTTAAPAPPTTAIATDPTLPVIVESTTTTAPAPQTVALPSALDANSGHSGPSAALLIGATGIGALGAGLAAWVLQSRLRRRPTRP
jgi:hypothetical protein